MNARFLRSAVAGAVLLSLASCFNDDNFCCGPVQPANTIPNSIAIQDVNGDGVPDLLVAATIEQGGFLNPGQASVILGNKSPAGTFLTAVAYPATGTNPSSIAVADLTSTGSKRDLVIANFGSGSVTVFLRGTPAGTYQNIKDYMTGGSPNMVAVGALSGSGNPDIVVADASVSGNVIILPHDPNNAGQFLPAVMLPTGATTSGVAIVDVNGDGLPDIVASTYDSNGNNGAVLVFLQNSPPGTSPTFAAPVSYPAGAQPQAVRAADLRGTGVMDLVVADLGPGTDGTGSSGVSVLLQTSTTPGTFMGFAAPITYMTAGGTVDVQAAPLRGSMPDIVAANLGPAPTGSVSVLLNNGDGTFGTATNYPGFGQPLAVAIADLNNDGHPDIAVADSPTAAVLIQSATSPGMFAAPVQVGQ